MRSAILLAENGMALPKTLIVNWSSRSWDSVVQALKANEVPQRLVDIIF